MFDLGVALLALLFQPACMPFNHFDEGTRLIFERKESFSPTHS